jgi:hypothetical protein
MEIALNERARAIYEALEQSLKVRPNLAPRSKSLRTKRDRCQHRQSRNRAAGNGRIRRQVGPRTPLTLHHQENATGQSQLGRQLWK